MSLTRSIPGGPPVETHTGVINTAIPVLSASQTIFNPQLLHAAKIAPLYIKQAEQITDSAKINIVSTVSKSFYNLLLTLEQIDVLKEDTARLGRNILDAYHQYVGGIVDETDYEQAIITLNNSKAQLKQQTENIVPEYAALKQLMGYPPEKHFNVVFDTTQMMQEISFDTTQLLQYEKRIEYQQLQTVKELQHQLTNYNKLSFLPTVLPFTIIIMNTKVIHLQPFLKPLIPIPILDCHSIFHYSPAFHVLKIYRNRNFRNRLWIGMRVI